MSQTNEQSHKTRLKSSQITKRTPTVIRPCNVQHATYSRWRCNKRTGRGTGGKWEAFVLLASQPNAAGSPLLCPAPSKYSGNTFWCCFQFGCLCSCFRFLLLHCFCCCYCCCCCKVCHFRRAHAYNFCLRLSLSTKQYRPKKQKWKAKESHKKKERIQKRRQKKEEMSVAKSTAEHQSNAKAGPT